MLIWSLAMKLFQLIILRLKNWEAAVSIVEKNPNQEVSITVIRDGEPYQQNITLSSGVNFKAGRVDQTIGLIGSSVKI